MRNTGLDEAQAGIKMARRIINDIRWHHPYGRKWRRIKEPLMKAKEESEKAGLKFNIQKTKIMATSPITSWQIDGKTWKQWQTIFLGSRITADSDYSHEIKRHLTPWKKSYDPPRQHMKKHRHYFADKGPSSQGYGFSSGHVWMWVGL